MNNKKRIILSITVISLVLLILVGLTYAYYVSNIQGNTGEKSINVDTAKLSLVYSDGNGNVVTASKIKPGDVIGSKTFTVTNDGNVENQYIVVLDNVSVTYSTTSGDQVAGAPASFVYNDFIYTITCSSSDNVDCNGATDETLPLYENGLIVTNKIAASAVQTYTITITYKNTDYDQSDDMNKALSARINIKDIKDPNMNPYRNNTSLLAYNIINNSMLKKNGTELRAESSTVPAEEINESTEKVLRITPDDYGDSYYFRGSVVDNYVNFAGMCWRIVRIEGDGSIKLILEDQDTLCQNINYTNGDGNWDIPTITEGNIKLGNYGYTLYASGDLNAVSSAAVNSSSRYLINYLDATTKTNNTASMAYAFKNFQVGRLSSYLNKLKPGDWCINNKGYLQSGSDPNYIYTELNANQITDRIVAGEDIYYDSYVRLSGKNENGYNLTLKCEGITLSDYNDSVENPTLMYVGTLTADEIVYAGGKNATNNNNYYLINNYQVSSGLYFWVLSPHSFSNVSDYAFLISYNGKLSFLYVNSNDRSFRPSVQLAVGTTISSGDGTKTNPYVIN